MAADDFPNAKRVLVDGLACNVEHPALNADMTMVLEQLRLAMRPRDDDSLPADWLLRVRVQADEALGSTRGPGDRVHWWGRARRQLLFVGRRMLCEGHD